MALLASAMPAPAAAVANDPDRDGLPSAFETGRTRTNPHRVDTDGDGIPDGAEDPDRDSLTNRQEYRSGTRPRRADSDGDGIRDDREDADRDGLLNAFEFRAGTHPRDVDSDNDGLRDGAEDPDRDGLSNRREYVRATNPRLADTDGDGWTDGTEASQASDPARATSVPTLPAAPAVPGAPACAVFPASNVWNLRVDRLPVARNSATMIAAIGAARGLHPDFGETLTYGIPYNVVTAATLRTAVTFEYDDESDHPAGGYPIPATPRQEDGSDGHILMLDADDCTLYELFAARRSGGGWSAGSGAVWDLRSNALRPAGWTSADAAGLPILPGLVRYDEVASGEIRHAIRFTTNVTRRAYLYPARHYASDDASPALPPMGLRVRLKASFDVSKLSPQARVIAVAMQRYGLILADNGWPWFFQGVSDPGWDDEQLNQLKRIPGSAFEVVETTGFRSGPAAP